MVAISSRFGLMVTCSVVLHVSGPRRHQPYVSSDAEHIFDLPGFVMPYQVRHVVVRGTYERHFSLRLATHLFE